MFRSLRKKLQAPFRLTLKGRVVDIREVETTQAGQPKRIFDLVDTSGAYVTCCAMKHSVDSAALQNFQEIIIFFATARGPIGGQKGMLYLLKDAMIVSVGEPSLLSSGKLEELSISG